MDGTIYVILKVQFDFALEVWFSIYAMDHPDITAPNFIGNFIDGKGVLKCISRGARDSKIGKKWPESSRILDYILS